MFSVAYNYAGIPLAQAALLGSIVKNNTDSYKPNVKHVSFFPLRNNVVPCICLRALWHIHGTIFDVYWIA